MLGEISITRYADNTNPYEKAKRLKSLLKR